MAATQALPVNDDDVVAKPLRHPWRWVSGVLVIGVLALFVYSLWASPSVDHGIIVQYLFNAQILNGAVLTVVITIVAMLIATILAVVLAVMKLSPNPLLKMVASAFIGFFRGTPLLLQIVFWGYLGIIYPTLTFGIPFTNIVFIHGQTSALIPSLAAGIIALALNEAAYSAEIVRAGILSVDGGQMEAAASLGMRGGYTLRRIILPQAMRVIIPPMGNEFISMLKNTALLEVVAVLELYTQSTMISAQNLAQVELLVVAGFWYLVMTTILSIPQRQLEKKYGRGFNVTTARSRMFGFGKKADAAKQPANENGKASA
jgi:polar amino acid transport system permease protein